MRLKLGLVLLIIEVEGPCKDSGTVCECVRLWLGGWVDGRE